MNYISRHCRIRNRVIASGEKMVYENNAGNLDEFMDSAFQTLSIAYPKFYKMDRSSKLGFLGAEVLLKDIKLTEKYRPERIAVVVSNSNASLDTDLRYFDSTKTIASPALFVYTLPNIVAGEICIRQGIKGENAFFVFPKFNASQLYGYAEILMASGKTDACIAGWVDVLGEQHDVFLYLLEKSKNGVLEHTAEELQKLYNVNYGPVDGGS
jgi:3-oxoacyl-(acyl-carrier-protein) synthase